ncbi:MAG: agmatine deiminase family protein [Candidatus Zixiibacteriota bacterium]
MRLIIGFVLLTILVMGSVRLMADDEEFLPIGLTDEEKTRLDEIGINHTKTAAPPGPIRNLAEWEPSEGVIIRWPLGISVSIVAEYSEDLIVTTIVGSTTEMNSAISSYTTGGVNMANAEFFIAPTNSIWTRDYGPWFIFDGNNELAMVDPIYNRPRPLDDVIPVLLGADWGMTVYGMDLATPGGNHMSDGLGTSMSTELVYNENTDKTPAEIDSIMLAYLGNDYEVLDYIESSGIHHIDCWAKFLSPTTIMVKDVPPSSSSYALLNARAGYLSQKISAWGVPYTIVRIYCPYGTAYTNSIILNNKVLVPLFGDSFDDSALATYENAMPGYEIIGFYGSWYDDDAIHCRAMGVPDRGMLKIEHVPINQITDNSSPYEIGAKIKAYSGEDIITDSLKIFYKTKSAEYFSVPLAATVYPDSFVGYIPIQSSGAMVTYYLQAADNSGRVETHPYIGAPGAHQFTIISNEPPEIVSDDSLHCQIEDSFGYCPTIYDPDHSSHTIEYIDYPGWLTVQNDSLIGTAPSFEVIDSFIVKVSDPYSYDSQMVYVYVYNDYICGDINNDQVINILDITFLINFLYKSGSEPINPAAADVNNSGEINILDITYLISFLYKNGDLLICD